MRRSARVLTVLAGVGYFFVWTGFGMAALPPGVAVAAVEIRLPALARAVPIAVGVAPPARIADQREAEALVRNVC